MLKKKHKIAIYSGSIPSTTFVERLIEGLSNNACQILLFGFKKDDFNYGSNISVFAYKNSKLNKVWMLVRYSLLLSCFKYKEKRKLDAILKAKSQNKLYDKMKCYQVLWHKPDVFHLQWAKGIAYWSWVQDFNIKLVLSLRGAHINYSPIADQGLSQLYKHYFPKVDRFHAVSQAIAIEAQKYGADLLKTDVIYSGLNSAEFENNFVTKKSRFNIISIGRSHWVKGYHYALDACKQLKDANQKFKYTIIGADGYLELQYQIKDLGLENHVVLKKSIPMEGVKKALREADVLLLPSIKEGIANVVLEAMASRTLVLTTDCGGMTEVVKHKHNGYVCSIRDAQAIKSALSEIMELSQNERKILLDNALVTVRSQHSQEQMVNKMLELYDQVLNSNQI